MKKIALLGVLVFAFALLANTASAGTYYYGGQALYSDSPYYGGNYYGSYSPNYYYQGQYQYVEPYWQGFPDYYYYRGRAPSDYYWRSQTWGDWDYGTARIYDKITYEHNEYYDFERARAYSTGKYAYTYLDPGYYNYNPGYGGRYWDGYGRSYW